MTGARSLSEFYIKLEFKRCQTCDCARNSSSPLEQSQRKTEHITRTSRAFWFIKSLRHNEHFYNANYRFHIRVLWRKRISANDVICKYLSNIHVCTYIYL
ncbi:hypothetical protein PUN28_004487 [Cardiocondyla obscurior]|uniref:Uncharacterized protein n=1 Tax=Cardiocondyla obscurior TaxID=286306 RepID=A0AAW2GAZ1_9HYME